MVIKANIAGWQINRVLIDFRSSVDIIFVNAFAQMKLSRNQLQPSNSPLIGFGGKMIDELGKISLPVSFGGQENRRTEYVTFDVVDLFYPYNAIFGRGFANKFNTTIHMGYLCMKMLALHKIIIVHSSQKEARNVERVIYKSQRNINSVEAARANSTEPPDMPKGKTDLKDQEEMKTVPLEDAVLDRKVTIGGNLSEEEEVELLETLAKNKDVFTWSASDLKGVNRDIVQHSLDINPRVKPKKQRQRKMSEMRILVAKTEVQRMMKAVLGPQQQKYIISYVDDIVVMSKNEGDHIADLKETFANLRGAGLKLNLEKCVFGVRRGKMLGYIIGPKGIKANPDKTKAIISMVEPSTKKEVQKLTGRIAALNRFISKSAERNLPFFKALRGRAKVEWGPEQSRVSQQLKNYLATKLMVTVQDPEAPLLMYVVAFDHTVCGVLVQEKGEESKVIQQPVYYISEALSEAKLNYTEIEKK
ncbi:uncharacterized protein [Miscanthus floridulus]|uniref:uncharacterized protein n=1 Tax=Miscanthus floridulus TaxID=154761 RepID=UPI0034591E67